MNIKHEKRAGTWLGAVSVSIIAFTLSVLGFFLVALYLVPFSGEGSIGGLSSANWVFTLGSSGASSAISIAMSLWMYVSLPVSEKHRALFAAVVSPMLCALAFFVVIAVGSR